MSAIIFRYLAKEILTVAFATILVLLLIFVSNQFIHYLNDAASGKLTLHAVLLVTVVQVPMLLGYILPIGLFLAILLTLGRYYVDHEMVVLAACGMSRWQMVNKIMLLSLLVTLLDAWLMLSVEPAMFRYRTDIVTHSVEEATLAKVLPGRFQTLGNDKQVLYVAKVDKRTQQFHDVFVAFRARQPEAHTQTYHWDILSSDTIRQQALKHNGDFFVFDQGARYAGVPGSEHYQILHFQQYWTRLPTPSTSVAERYSAMTTTTLLQRYRSDHLAVAELQWRVMIVLSTLVFALLAIPLSEVNPRKGKFAQLLPAILIYVLYANLMFVGKGWIQNQVVSPAIGLWWILAALLLLAGVLFGMRSWWWQCVRLRRSKMPCS